MNLTEYPQLIATAERAVLEQSQVCRELSAAVETRKSEIEGMVANDPSLTNDAKRKAMKQDLMSEEVMARLIEQLQAAQDKLSELRIEVNLIRDCYQVAVLMMQDEIASKRLQVTVESVPVSYVLQTATPEQGMVELEIERLRRIIKE